MIPNTTSEGTNAIVVDYDLPSPPEKVWRALTEPALLGAWLMENDIAPVVGHRFTFRAKPMPGWDGIVHCEVLVVEPNARLVYAWRGGAKEGPGGALDTTVTWTLTPNASGGTRLHLEHAGFTPANAFAYENMGKGWRGKIAERIEAILAGSDS